MVQSNRYLVQRKRDGQFWTGSFDEFTPDASKAASFSEAEMKIRLIFRGERWVDKATV